MMNLQKELLDFQYRELSVPLRDLFPNLQTSAVPFASVGNPHQTILNVIRDLWTGGYDSFLQKNGFWENQYSSFSGHCHQCTPILGAALKSLGFEISYLECMRVREHVAESGVIEKVPPTEEPDPKRIDEFCSINRIPYCCLEVMIDGEPHYITGKHIKPERDGFTALLAPVCYRDFTGVFRHQEAYTKSGIYLRPVLPKRNPDGRDFTRQIIWTKQTARDPAPECFATFLRMKLV
jgi:hypothetical protein